MPRTEHKEEWIMTAQKIIVGLDIGTTKVCAIVGRLNEFGKIDVLGMGKASFNGRRNPWRGNQY